MWAISTQKLLCIYIECQKLKEIFRQKYVNKTNMMVLIAATSFVIFQTIDFQPFWPWNLIDEVDKQKGTSSMLLEAMCVISWPSVNPNYRCQPETLNSGQNCRIFGLCDLLKFDGQSWKTIGHHFYAPSSFVHHFLAICEFKLDLESGSNLAHVTLKFGGWPWKTIWHLSYTPSSFFASFRIPLGI